MLKVPFPDQTYFQIMFNSSRCAHWSGHINLQSSITNFRNYFGQNASSTMYDPTINVECFQSILNLFREITGVSWPVVLGGCAVGFRLLTVPLYVRHTDILRSFSLG